MTRESKLAMMIAVTLILLVGVLLSDHLSGARTAEFDEPAQRQVVAPVAEMPGMDDPVLTLPMQQAAALPQQSPGAGADEGLGGFAEPFQISQGPDRNIISQAMDRIRDAEPRALVILDPPTNHGLIETPPESPARPFGGLFEPVGRLDTTLPPRDPDGDRPIKALPETAGQGGTPAPAPTSAPAPTRSAPERTTTWKTHTVASGDSLYRLAERYLGDGKRWRELQRLNSDVLVDEDQVQVGTVLKISQVSAAPATTRSGSASAGQSVRHYVVLKGDSLGTISQKLLGTSRRMGEIVELNGLKDPDDVRIGQTLKIPAR